MAQFLTALLRAKPTKGSPVTEDEWQKRNKKSYNGLPWGKVRVTRLPKSLHAEERMMMLYVNPEMGCTKAWQNCKLELDDDDFTWPDELEE